MTMIPLFDAQTGFGGLPAGKPAPVELDELLSELEHLSIARALVRFVPDEQERDVPDNNAMLFEACDPRDELTPCPIVMPNTAYDMAPEAEQVATAIVHGAGAAWVRPQHDVWVLRDWACGALFRALEEKRLPAYCLQRDFSPVQIGDLAGDYPDLPIIYSGLGYRDQRTFIPLAQTFANVYLAIGYRFSVHDGIEQLVQHVGADRVLFGTGFPESEAGMAVTQLTYADLSDDDKAKIGSGNMSRLMEGIRQ
jgi:uncharacterized protein